MSLVLDHITFPTDDARLLIGELDEELNSAYSAEQRHGFDIARIFQPNISFFIARLDGQPAGCGGVAIEDDFAELKRMYVRPALRGRGVAQAIVARLEQQARAAGIPRLMLETGDAQLAAIRFYEREGFERCSAFGVYAKMPARATRRCIFFQKQIL